MRIVSSKSIVMPPLPVWPQWHDVRVTFAESLPGLIRHSPMAKIAMPKDSRFIAVPTSVIEPAAKWTLEFMAALGLKNTEESLDCDDFTLELDRTFSRMVAKAGIQAAPLTGWIDVFSAHSWAKIPAGGAHELAIAMTENGWAVIESQNAISGPLEIYPNRTHIIEAGGF